MPAIDRKTPDRKTGSDTVSIWVDHFATLGLKSRGLDFTIDQYGHYVNDRNTVN